MKIVDNVIFIFSCILLCICISMFLFIPNDRTGWVELLKIYVLVPFTVLVLFLVVVGLYRRILGEK